MRNWRQWMQDEQRREKAERLRWRQRRRLLARLDAVATNVHARDLRPRLARLTTMDSVGCLPACEDDDERRED